jgi:3',5'-cyclic AMP phosphodiesterase CpdA
MTPGGFVQQALSTPVGLCLLLDTLDQGKDGGRLCERRLAWLRARLEESGNAPVFLFLHHPPMQVGIAGMDAIALADPEALWAVLAPHRACIRHLFHGHLHRPIAGSWRGIPISSLRGSAFDVALDLAPPPRRVTVEPALAPNYALVRVRGEDVVVHTRALPPSA